MEFLDDANPEEEVFIAHVPAVAVPETQPVAVPRVVFVAPLEKLVLPKPGFEKDPLA